jgi:DNA-binding NarL/FixJ family response regulator
MEPLITFSKDELLKKSEPYFRGHSVLFATNDGNIFDNPKYAREHASSFKGIYVLTLTKEEMLQVINQPEPEIERKPSDPGRISEALELKKQGLSNVSIARKFNVSETCIRKWLKRSNQVRAK